MSDQGRPALVEGEPSIRKSVTIPEGILGQALSRAHEIDGDFSKYVRRLIEQDLKG